MNDKTLLIKNGHIVNSQEISKKDIFVKNGKINKIDSNIDLECDRVIDATGLYIIPGAIDPPINAKGIDPIRKGNKSFNEKLPAFT